MTEYQLIIFLIKCFITKSRAEPKSITLSSDFDWNHFYELSLFHNVRPVIFNQLKLQSSISVPRDILERLEAYCRKNTIKIMGNQRSARLIVQELNKLEVQAIPFKGFHLSSTYYGDIGLRESSDIDFFFESKHLEPVKKVMSKLNYFPYTAMTSRQEKVYLKMNCEYNFTDIPGERSGTFVEYHWASGPRHLLLQVGLDRLRHYIDAKNSMSGFDRVGSIITTVLHHGCKERYRKLKYLLDLVMLTNEAEINEEWKNVEKEFRELSLYKILLIGIMISYETLEIPIPDYLKSQLEELDSKEYAELKKQLDYSSIIKIGSFKNYTLKLLKFHWKYRDSTLDKLRLVWNHILIMVLPNYRDYKDTKLPEHLHFLLFFIKPFRLLKQHR